MRMAVQNNKKEFEVEVEVSMKEVVMVEANSKEEAKDLFLNDVAKYSSMVDNLTYDKNYNGISNVVVE